MADRFDDDEVEEIVKENPDLQKLSKSKQRGAVENARREQDKQIRKPKPK